MVQFRPRTREIIAKVVYYGPPLGGKTTNLRTLYAGYPPETRGELVVVPAGGDRTIFFDFLPVDAGTLRGMRMRVQLYTVPGQVHYNATRQVVLRGADAIAFVADSQRELLRSNRESWENLKDNLALQGLTLADMPHVLQYNKRDLKDVLSIDDLDDLLNEFNAPFYEAVATEGIGVEETLQGLVKLVARSLRDRFRMTTGEESEFAEPLPATPVEAPPFRPDTKPTYTPPVPTFGLSPSELALGTPGPEPAPAKPLPFHEPAGARVYSFAPAAPPAPGVVPLPPLSMPPPEAPPPPSEPPEFQFGEAFGADAGMATPGLTGKVIITPAGEAVPEAPWALGDPFETPALGGEGLGADVFEIAPPAVTPAVAVAVVAEEAAAPVTPEPAAAAEQEALAAADGPAAEAPVDESEPATTAELPPEAGQALVQRIVPRALAQVGEVRELELEVPVPAQWTGGKRLTLQFRLTLIPEEDAHAE